MKRASTSARNAEGTKRVDSSWIIIIPPILGGWYAPASSCVALTDLIVRVQVNGKKVTLLQGDRPLATYAVPDERCRYAT